MYVDNHFLVPMLFLGAGGVLGGCCSIVAFILRLIVDAILEENS